MQTRILLVEDDPGTVELMQQELEVLGYEVTVAENGVEAVKMASSQLPDRLLWISACLRWMDSKRLL